MKIDKIEEIGNKDNQIRFTLSGYKYRGNELCKTLKEDELRGIAYGQPVRISKIDYGLPTLTGETNEYEIEWAKVTYTQQGREGKTNTLRKTFRGTKKQIISYMLNDNIFYNDNECKNYINKLLAVYGDDKRVIQKIEERKLILKPYKTEYKEEEFKWFLEWTKTMPEYLQYTFGTHFIQAHFTQYFKNQGWLNTDKIKLGLLNGDSETFKTAIMIFIIIPALSEEDLTAFDGNLRTMIIPIPNTYASIRDSLAYPNRIVGFDEIHNQLDNGYRFHPDIHSLLLNWGMPFLPSKKDEDGDNTRVRWTGYILMAFNDPIKLDTQMKRRIDYIKCEKTEWDPRETLKPYFPKGIIPREYTISAMQNLIEAVAEQIFNYPDQIFDIEKLKQYVWGNLGAPWLAEAQNNENTPESEDEQITDKTAMIRSYLSNSKSSNINFNPKINEPEPREQIIDYFKNQGIIIENNEGEYFLRKTKFVEWFKGRVLQKDTGFNSKEAWKILVDIFNIDEETYSKSKKINGRVITTTFEVPIDFTDKIEM